MEQAQQNYIVLPGGLLTDEQWEWFNERDAYFRELRLKEKEKELEEAKAKLLELQNQLKENEAQRNKEKEYMIGVLMNNYNLTYAQASQFLERNLQKGKFGILQKIELLFNKYFKKE